ncbi:MAG: Rrf2 family transcriptional regulator [Spirochaetes bacterium]|nr:Rrf2 family transcriptional regulator [Spirochaetota bacterium]
MLQISTKIQYATRALIYIALNYKGKPLPLSEISRHEHISEKYLGSILVILKTAGVVLSIKGKYGGYQLAKSPDRISIYDIIIAFESNILLSRETAGSEIYNDHYVWQEIESYLEERLRLLTIDAIVRKLKRNKQNINYQI